MLCSKRTQVVIHEICEKKLPKPLVLRADVVGASKDAFEEGAVVQVKNCGKFCLRRRFYESTTLRNDPSRQIFYEKSPQPSLLELRRARRTSGLSYRPIQGSNPKKIKGYKLCSKILLFLFLINYFYSCNANFIIRKSSSKITVKSGATLVIDNSINNFVGELSKEDGAEISGGKIYFCDGIFNDNNNKVRVNGEFDLGESKNIILDGSKAFKGKNRTVKNEIKMSGKENRLEGAFELEKDVILQDENTSFTCALSGRMPRNISLAGGEIFLEEDLHFIDGMFFTGDGVVRLNKRKLKLGSTVMPVDVSLYFDDAGDIELGGNLQLSQTWTFSGTSILQGNGKILYLEEGGNIVVEKGSSLLFQNISIRNVKDNNIRCLDTYSTLSFQDVQLVHDNNYSFTVGCLDIIGDFTLKGDSVFAYQSAQDSYIRSHGKIIIDNNMTFSFDPMWNSTFTYVIDEEEWGIIDDWDAAREFLNFEDSTSMFILDNSTLHITSTYLKLTKGVLKIKGCSTIDVEMRDKMFKEEGLIIGDNSSDFDMKCQFSSGSLLKINSGSFSYKNINSDSWDMNRSGSLLQMLSGSKLKLHQSIYPCSGIVEFYGNSKFARTRESKIDGNINVLGPIYYERCFN